MRRSNFLRLISNKVTSRSYSYFLNFSYFYFLENWFFQLRQRLQSLARKTQGILGVKSGTPKHLRPHWVQSCLKTALLESKVDCVKLGPFLVFPTIRSCSWLVFLHVHQILHTHLYHLQDCKVQFCKKKFFSPVLKAYSNVLRALKSIFFSREGSRDFKFIFLCELGTCPQNLIPMRCMKPRGKRQFALRGMLKFTY
jgi:hypothetical protein